MLYHLPLIAFVICSLPSTKVYNPLESNKNASVSFYIYTMQSLVHLPHDLTSLRLSFQIFENEDTKITCWEDR